MSKHDPSELMKQVSEIPIFFFPLLLQYITLVHLDGNDFFYVKWLIIHFYLLGAIFFYVFVHRPLLNVAARPANLCTYIILYVINVPVYRIPPPLHSVQMKGVCKPTNARNFQVKKSTQTLLNVDDRFVPYISSNNPFWTPSLPVVLLIYASFWTSN